MPERVRSGLRFTRRPAVGPAACSRRRAWTLAIALFGALALAVQPLRGEPVGARVELSPAYTTVRPGTEVTLSWSQLPADTKEFELLLVSDSPAALTLRLTESMDPAQGSFLWRVPNVPCARARILVRMGDEEEEREWAASAAFGIAWDQQIPMASVRSQGGEFWLSEEPTHAPATSLSDGGPALDRTRPGRHEEARGLVPSRDFSLPVSPAMPRHAVPGARAVATAQVVRKPSSPPLIPLRI